MDNYLNKMYKSLIKNILILIYPIFTFGSEFAYAHRKFDIKNKTIIEINKAENIDASKKTSISLEEKIEKNFEDYQSFEDSTKPSNQFLNLFGLGGFADQRLKDSSFKLWDTYEKEMSNQIGNKKLNGTDIDNTYNGSLKTIGH